MNLLYRINPELEIKIMFFLKNGYKLNLKNPVTYNEKIQWIKFYDKNKRIPICADKYTVRNYVKECGCEAILNHLLWEGFQADDIPFEALPDRFVIKVTHGSGFNILCRDKSKLNIDKVKKQLNYWLKEKYIRCYGEWFYGVQRPRIMIEEYLGDANGEPPYDYKVLCFNGEPRFIEVHLGRFTNHQMKIYDMDWNEIRGIMINNYEAPNVVIEKPRKIKDLIEYAKKLSEPFYHARIDFYIVNETIYFGEITFTGGSGFDKIAPYSFDVELGTYLKLPQDIS
jgi:hypothetical protein